MQSPNDLPDQPEGDVRRERYWRENVRLILWMLAAWLLLSVGCGVLFVDFLNQFRIGGYKLGFWFAQQGAVYGFLALILIYSRLIDRIDRAYHVEERN